MRSTVKGVMRAPIPTFERARKLRRSLSLPEVLLWEALRGSGVEGLRFRRQHPLGPYILDFYCPAQKLAIEVDGAVHDTLDQATHDERRDRWLSRQGIRVLRVPAADVLSASARDDVLATIAAFAPSTAFGGPPRCG